MPHMTTDRHISERVIGDQYEENSIVNAVNGAFRGTKVTVD